VAVSVTIVGSSDPRLEFIVRESGKVAKISSVPDFKTLLDPRATHPDVVLVDLRGAREVPAQLGALKRQHPATNVILLLSTLEPTLMLQAIRAGVNECIAEPISAAELAAAIGRLVGNQSLPPGGPVFAFVGAKGGVGTTTTAVNVATALAKLSSASALLVDLHLAYGDAAVFLGADTRFSVLDAIENLHRLDAQFLKSLVVKTASGLDLLASADRPSTRVPDLSRLGSVIDLAARQYAYTILDVPRSDLTVLDGLDAASRLVVVANQELATVRNAGRMAAALKARYPKATVTTIINRMDRRSEIGHGDVEKAVGSTIAHQFPSDYRRALTAMHKGRPLALDNHNDLSASFTSLARELAGVEPKTKATPSSGGGLLGLLGRK
jgi:pilus assembly protein CpaE